MKVLNPTPGHISREKHGLKKYMHPNVHFSTVYNSQDMEATKCPSTEEQIKKTCYAYTYIHTYTHTHTHTHIVDYYSGIKKIIMPFAATRTDIEIVILK